MFYNRRIQQQLTVRSYLPAGTKYRRFENPHNQVQLTCSTPGPDWDSLVTQLGKVKYAWVPDVDPEKSGRFGMLISRPKVHKPGEKSSFLEVSIIEHKKLHEISDQACYKTYFQISYKMPQSNVTKRLVVSVGMPQHPLAYALPLKLCTTPGLTI